MFLKKIIEDNSRLVEFVIKAHQEGVILPDSYLLDVDIILENAKLLIDSAHQAGLKCVYMSKQLGRNPDLAVKLESMGFDGAVAVDFREALTLMSKGLKIYNVGHLVQTPQHLLQKFIQYGVEYITVYSLEKLAAINEAAKNQNKKQKIIIKVLDQESLIYDGQQGGFTLEALRDIKKYADELDFIDVRGVTSFPCFVFDANTSKVVPTNNFYLTISARDILIKEGFNIDEVNVPSLNITSMMGEIARLGGTTVEPGHALTGTTPYHKTHSESERIAIAYVSEISHHFNGKSYCFGGGYYRRSNIENALIINQKGEKVTAKIRGPYSENIDYYLELEGMFPVGSTVILCFRTQIFTTRSEVVLVEGLHSNLAIQLSHYDSQGKKL